MSVNGVVDTFQVQNTSAGANQMAAAEMRQIDKEYGEKRAEEQSNAKKLLENKSNTSRGRQVVQDLVSKLAGSGIKLTPDNFISKASNSAKDEYDMLLKGEEEGKDSVDIKSSIKAAKRAKQNRGGKGQQQDAQSESQKTAKTVSEFSAAFVDYLLSGGTEKKKNAERLEQQLKAKGLTDADLLSIKNNIRKSIRAQIASQLKESFIKRMFSKEKSLEWAMNHRNISKTVNYALNSKGLGGEDFGNFKDGLPATIKDAFTQSGLEIRDFARDGLKNALVSKHLGNPAADAEIKEMLELGAKCGVNFRTLKGFWMKEAFHLGITPPPPEAFQQSSLGSGMQGQGGQSGYEYTKDDDKELLVNQLRALYMKRAIRGNLRTRIETSFKIRKLKNGLIKLNITFADFEKLEMEAGALGRAKLLEMLGEAFHERATLYALAGPAFQLIEKKIKGLVKNLERLGMELTKLDLDSVRDKANHDMFDVARNELENTIILYEGTRSPSLEKKVKLLIKLLLRLKEESNIETDFDPELRFSSVASAA